MSRLAAERCEVISSQEPLGYQPGAQRPVSAESGKTVTNLQEQKCLIYDKNPFWNLIETFKVTQRSQIVPAQAIALRNGYQTARQQL